MIIGNAAWGLRETPLARQLEITSHMGLTLLELSIAGYHRDQLQLESSPKDAAEVAKLFASFGVSPACGATGNDFTGDDWQKQVEHVKRVIEIAADVGVEKLRIFAGFSSDSAVYGNRLDNMLRALSLVGEFAAAHHIVPAVETHGGLHSVDGASFYFASPSTRADIWQRILETGVSMNFDPANLAAVGVEPVAFYRQFASSIDYVHLKDFRPAPHGLQPAACGDPGLLDWPALLGALQDYSGPALIEYEVPADVEDGLARSLRFLTAAGAR